MPYYKEMTATARQAAWNDNREAVNIHQDHFAMRPYRGTRADREAWNDMNRAAQCCKLIANVARKLGDTWPTNYGV